MLPIKDPNRDLLVYLEKPEVEKIRVSAIKATIYEKGRKKMSHKTLEIWASTSDGEDWYAGKEKDAHNTEYKVPLTSLGYQNLMELGATHVRIADPHDRSKDQLVRVKNVEKLSFPEQSEYQRLKVLAEKASQKTITNSQPQHPLSASLQLTYRI